MKMHILLLSLISVISLQVWSANNKQLKVSCGATFQGVSSRVINENHFFRFKGCVLLEYLPHEGSFLEKMKTICTKTIESYPSVEPENCLKNFVGVCVDKKNHKLQLAGINNLRVAVGAGTGLLSLDKESHVIRDNINMQCISVPISSSDNKYFLIFASDNFWNVIDEKTAMRVLQEADKEDDPERHGRYVPTLAKTLAKMLKQKALCKVADQDLDVIVIRLDWVDKSLTSKLLDLCPSFITGPRIFGGIATLALLGGLAYCLKYLR